MKEESTEIDFAKLALQAKRNGLTKRQTKALLDDVKHSLPLYCESPRAQEEKLAATTIMLALLLQDNEVVVRASTDDVSKWQWRAA